MSADAARKSACATRDGRDGRALHQIAGVQEDAVATIRALAADDGGEVCKTAIPVFEREQTGVKVVGMEDGQGSYFGC